jgi:hypothetical protein
MPLTNEHILTTNRVYKESLMKISSGEKNHTSLLIRPKKKSMLSRNFNVSGYESQMQYLNKTASEAKSNRRLIESYKTIMNACRE